MPVHPYDLLIRLQKRRLDDARGPLDVTNQRLEEVARAKGQLRTETAREAEIVQEDPSLALELGRFLNAARTEIRGLEAREIVLAQGREREVEALQRERVELRRLELLAERARQRAARERTRRSERELAELVLTRRAGRRMREP